MFDTCAGGPIQNRFLRIRRIHASLDVSLYQRYECANRHQTSYKLPPFKLGPIPLPQIRACSVSTLKKSSEIGFGRLRCTHGLIWKNEFGKIAAIKCSGRLYGRGFETWRFRCCVRIERRLSHSAAAGPETVADHFVRVRLSCHCVRSGALRCATPRKSTNGQIETSPKEMDRAAFADKARAKALQNRLD